MRAAVYVRLSRETEDTTSPERQRADCQAHIEREGWKHDPDRDEYADIDVSAWSDRGRPAFERMMGSLELYDVLVVWKLDRLLRSVRRDLGRILDACDAHGVRLVSVTEGIDNRHPSGQLILTFLAGLADHESATTSMRIRSAKQYLLQRGRWAGGPAPFGWRAVDHPDGGKVLVLHDQEADLLREAVDRVLQGESARAVCSDWNARGLRTHRDTLWKSKSLLTILRNPRLIGQQRINVRDGGGDVVRDDDGDPLIAHEPLLDHHTWRRLQRTLTNIGFNRSRRRDACLLSGVIVCGLCDTTMSGWSADHPQATYACRLKSQAGKGGCRGLAIKRSYTDTAVRQAIAARAADPEKMEASWRRYLAETDERPDPARIEVDRLRSALDRLEHDRLELGLYDGQEDRYAARHRELAAQLRDAEGRLRPAGEVVAPLAEVVPAGVNLAEDWDDQMDMVTQRAIVRSAIGRIVVGPSTVRARFDPERLTIRWRDM